MPIQMLFVVGQISLVSLPSPWHFGQDNPVQMQVQAVLSELLCISL